MKRQLKLLWVIPLAMAILALASPDYSHARGDGFHGGGGHPCGDGHGFSGGYGYHQRGGR